MKNIPLVGGGEAVVDDEDFDFLTKWKWFLHNTNSTEYAMRAQRTNGKRKTIFMHRVINDTPDGLKTDHVNGNGLDNRRENLRTATTSQNGFNRLPDKGGTSRYKGVSWQRKTSKWLVMIQVNKKRTYLGLFTNEEDAAMAYAERAKQDFGEFNREVFYD